MGDILPGDVPSKQLVRRIFRVVLGELRSLCNGCDHCEEAETHDNHDTNLLRGLDLKIAQQDDRKDSQYKACERSRLCQVHDGIQYRIRIAVCWLERFSQKIRRIALREEHDERHRPSDKEHHDSRS